MDVSQDFAEKAKAMVGSWPSFAALGSFLLYFLGYLSLRFHLTAFGVGTDLAILDERYLFAGAKFLVYIFTTVPIVMLLALLLAVIVLSIAGLLYLPYRRLSTNTRSKLSRSFNWKRHRVWVLSPTLLSIAGIVISLLLIQLVMRQCFNFSNLLLADGLREPDWVGSGFASGGLLRSILISEGGTLSETFYFGALVAGVAVTVALLLTARKRKKQMLDGKKGPSLLAGIFIALLGFLVAVQILLLPVNYGVLVMDKVLPRVADLGGKEPVPTDQGAWLVWEGRDGVTYLVGSLEQNSIRRKLITLSRSDIKRTEIVRYDPILKCLFVAQGCRQ